MEDGRNKDQSGSRMPARRERGWVDPWGRFSEEVDRMFDELWHPSFFRRGRMPRMYTPRIDVLERDGSLVVRADLPGIKRDDLEVEVTDNMLVLRGERRQEEEEQQDEGYYRAERSYGSFARSIPLPEGVDPEQVKATFHDGVLEIRIPVPQRHLHSRRIQIDEEGRRAQETPRARMAAQGGQGGGQGAGPPQGRSGTAAGRPAAPRAPSRTRADKES